MVTRAKPVTWPRVRWTPVDDSRLLVGVMKHGIGNWDSIRDDPDLNMDKKVSAPYSNTYPSLSLSLYVSLQILSQDKSRKPQASHLLTRVEYLLKLLVAEARTNRQKVSCLQFRESCCPTSLLQGGKRGKKAAASAKPVHRTATRTRKPVSKPVKPPSRTIQTTLEPVASLMVQVPRDLLVHCPDGAAGEVQHRKSKRPVLQDRIPVVKKPKVDLGRGRVSSFSEEDWEEKELDDEVFKKV